MKVSIVCSMIDNFFKKIKQYCVIKSDRRVINLFTFSVCLHAREVKRRAKCDAGKSNLLSNDGVAFVLGDVSVGVVVDQLRLRPHVQIRPPRHRRRALRRLQARSV